MRLQLGAHGGTEGEAPQRRGQSLRTRERPKHTLSTDRKLTNTPQNC